MKETIATAFSPFRARPYFSQSTPAYSTRDGTVLPNQSTNSNDILSQESSNVCILNLETLLVIKEHLLESETNLPPMRGAVRKPGFRSSLLEPFPVLPPYV